MIGLAGLSNSGKSTLLHALAGLLVPTAGTIERNGTTLTVRSRRERDVRTHLEATVTEADDDELETVRNDELGTALSLSAAVAVLITVRRRVGPRRLALRVENR